MPTETEINNMDGSEAFDAYLEEKRFFHFEGTTGIRNLETICKTLGYRNGSFIGEHFILNFLADNPGAIESLIDFIRDNADGEWEESFKEELPYEDEEENKD